MGGRVQIMCAHVDANGIDCVCVCVFVQIMCVCVDANGVDWVCVCVYKLCVHM